MRRRHVVLALLASLASTLAHAASSETGDIRRFALTVGANEGAPGRVRLRYAVTDAERFSRLMTRLGGVRETDAVVLRDPNRGAFFDSLAVVRERAGEARRRGERTEVVLYFSGHADETGLMLGRERLAYQELRDALGDLPTDVGIAVLDACASGAITRLKGGKAHRAFLRDASLQVRGRAYLTSSSDSEAAQESDRLKGSYFTHALVSGLHGAADASGDGRVTLGEAYQFAFHQTLSRTSATSGGAQHPAYDIRLAGTGDVVLTDLREATSSLILAPEMDGRFFIWSADDHLVAELYKAAGRPVELGVEPGEYEIRLEREADYSETRVTVAEGERLSLTRANMKPTKRQPARARGGPSETRPTPYSLDGRSRFEMRFGVSNLNVSHNEWTDALDVTGGDFSLAFAHWVHENLALELTLGASNIGVSSRQTSAGEVVRAEGFYRVMAGGRFYLPVKGAFRPHVSLAVGPWTEVEVHDDPWQTEVTGRTTKAGLEVGGGVDFLLGGHFVVGVHASTIVREGYSSHLNVGCTLGWGFGGRPKG